MKKHVFRRALAFGLSLLMLGQSAYAAELVDAYKPDYVSFTSTGVPADYEGQDLFWFGSTDMTVSETSRDYYLMRVLRGGSCEGAASVTVKFTDLTAEYGVNYTVRPYDEEDVLGGSEGVMPIVDFLQENSDAQYEGDPLTQSDVYDALTTGGLELLDGSGESLATLSLNAAEEAEDEAEVTTLSDEESAEDEDALVVDASDYTAIDSEQEGLYADDYPGREITLYFAEGENEKLIVVDPIYSSAADGDCTVTASFRYPSDGMAYVEDGMTTTITITDEDTLDPAVLSIEKAEYYADGDTVAITFTREGAINNIVSAYVKTSSDEAEEGVDYQGAYAQLTFPMGIRSRTVELQVNHIRDKELTFTVELVDPTGCSLENASAVVTIAAAADAEAAAAEAAALAASGSTGLLKSGSAAAVVLSAFSGVADLTEATAVLAEDEPEAEETETTAEAAAEPDEVADEAETMEEATEAETAEAA